MKNIKVSVIVPVYNVEQYLSKCLDSLVNQTLQEIEILVVNDGSPDNSQAIIDDYSKRYPDKIRAFTKENGGLSDARNFAIQYATGEYIAFVDSDDYVDIDMYELMYNKAKDTDSDIVNCAFSSIIGRTIRRNYYSDSIQFFGESVAQSPKILRFANSYAWNKIYRKDFWLKHNFKFPVGQWFEDSALIYNVMGMANKVECVNIPFYYYVKSRSDSITNTVDHRIFDIFKSLESIISFYKKFPQTPELQEEINYLCLRHSLARVFKLDEFEDSKLAKKFVNKCYAFYNKNLPNWKANSFGCAPETAKPKTKRTCFINRHKNLAKFYYCTNILKTIETWYEEKFENVKKVTLSYEERIEKENEKKRAAIQKNGIALIALVQRLLKEIDIDSFADFGTMLGIIREGKLLAHDLDIDMGVIVKDKVDLERIRLHLEKFGFNIWRQYFFDDFIVEDSYRFCGIKIDLNYYKITDDNSKTWLFYREPDKEYLDNERNIVEMTYSPITDFKEVEVAGETIRLPANAEQLLEEKYGPTWRTPDKGWIYWLSPAATKIPQIGFYIDYRYKRVNEVNEDWFAKIKSKELNRNRKYQLQQIKVLKAISKICKKHKITYYLGNSTLRFAEHYSGLAPWEANLFLTMKRKQYKKFLNYASKELSEKFVLQHYKTVENYWSPYMTVRLASDNKFYQKKLEGITDFNGPCVHILPLCSVPEPNSKKQKKQSELYKYYRSLLQYKSGVKIPVTKEEERLSKRADSLSYKKIHKKLEKVYSMFKGTKCNYLVNLADIADIQKTTNPKEFYGKPEYIDFEGLSMPIPSHSDEILKKRYGYNYDKLEWNKRKIGLGVGYRKKSVKE